MRAAVLRTLAALAGGALTLAVCWLAFVGLVAFLLYPFRVLAHLLTGDSP